ncbi:hypothetical protein DCAR_0313674 [Daucus carota subsp. sativus]|uniref:Protein ABIL5 n=1 Tax=Daucus carota subsp. sativus TaxID=79200 RepID=A0AAF1ATE0_DAUCS|nr:hypothetical protein DCAR_0313674 [Daucus carota subsp. sativus]
MVEPKLLENPKVEAETPVEIELEVKTKPEVGLEAEDEAEAKTKAEAEAEADELTCFDKSLQELKDLRSQLYNAADYCQATFKNATHKQMVINNTKQYLCHAIVTVVDHLGSVSANLNQQVSAADFVSETEIRMVNLKQKLSTCQQYTQKLALHKVSWRAEFPQYHPRYIMHDVDNGKARIIKKERDTKTEGSLVSFKYKPLLFDSSNLSKLSGFSKPGLLAENGLVIQPKSQHQLSQFQEKRKIKHRVLNWKPKEMNDLVSLIKWKRMT